MFRIFDLRLHFWKIDIFKNFVLNFASFWSQNCLKVKQKFSKKWKKLFFLKLLLTLIECWKCVPGDSLTSRKSLGLIFNSIEWFEIHFQKSNFGPTNPIFGWDSSESLWKAAFSRGCSKYGGKANITFLRSPQTSKTVYV